MSLTPGSRLGSLEVVALLGAGGMGEVYRARDTRLHRDVAVKVLPARFLSSAERRARFEREAHMLASLNHPHIAQIYGLEHSDAGDALVMELVEGRTLADRVRSGPIAYTEAMEISWQIADALYAAHDRGIVHRDLKPANIKVRDDGTVKVLDFGLAKALGPESGGETSSDVANSPTMSAPAMTEQGVILGTVGYMSPEQARGRPVDRRADIWAFGCVLYEMIVGQRAFTGDTVTDVLAAVVGTEPDLSRVPLPARRLLRACLQKDPKRRLRDIGDAKSLIDDVAPASGPAPALASRASRYALAALVLIAVAAIAWAMIVSRRAPAASSSMRFDLPMPEGQLGMIMLSPDGRYLLYSTRPAGAEPHLILRTVATGEVRDVPGSEGSNGGFWSPDSQTIAFVVRNALKTVPVGGGTPTVITAQGISGRGCWAADGFIMMDSAEGISKVPAGGGPLVAITKVDHARRELHHEQPACMPDGRFLYFRHLAERGTSGIYLGDPRLTPDRQRLTPLLVAADGPVFVPASSGSRRDLLFMQDTTLFVQSFDVDRAEFVGEPTRVADPVFSTMGSGLFSASVTGLLVFVSPPTVERQLTWIDRNGGVGAKVGPAIRVLRGLRVSPAGDRAMLVMFPQDRQMNNDDLWVLPFDGRPLTPFVTEDSVETGPLWSDDGRRVAYVSNRIGSGAVYQQPISGGAPEQISAPIPLTPLSDWSRDGRFMLFTRAAPDTGNDIWILRPGSADRKPEPLIHGPSSENGGVLSPDGRWLAYLSNQSGRDEVYVRRFTVSTDGTPAAPEEGKQLVSNGARGLLRWRHDGRELLYMSADGKMMSVEVTASPTTTFGRPRALFTFPDDYLRANPAGTGIADMAPDGSRWLAAMPPENAPPPALHVIVNWRSPSR